MSMNYYEVLGIANTAGPEEIKKAYRKLASQHHPDKGGDTAKFQQIEEAYRILSDPQRRAEFDNPPQPTGHFNFNFNGNDVNINDIFNQFGFDPFGRPQHPFHQQPRRNKDIRANISLRLRETLEDQNKTLNIRTEGSQKNVDIRVPRGITSGTTIKYPGLGDILFGNLPPGDLYITVLIEAEPDYQTSGLDIVTSLTIDCFQAILGSEQTVYGLDGKQFVIQTPQGCQPGTKLKISGEGLWEFQKDVKGSLFINISVSIPKNLTEDQKHLIQSIANQR